MPGNDQRHRLGLEEDADWSIALARRANACRYRSRAVRGHGEELESYRVAFLSFSLARVYPMNRPTRLVSSFAAALLAVLSASSHSSAAPGDGAKDKVFVGYAYGEPRAINFRLYTHLCHAFLVADGEGNVRPRRNVPSRELTESAHKAGVKVILSLGGWGWDRQFASIVAKPESEDRYVKSVMTIVDQNDYDGIDLDWEYPDTQKEIAGFERLTRRLRQQVDALGQTKKRRMVLTMAAAADRGTLSWLSKEFLLETMDWINVMTYDFTGGRDSYAGHHSPLFASSKQPAGEARSAELTIKYLLEERGVPADRLALGIPLYGRGFGVKEPYASTKGAVQEPRSARGRLQQHPPAHDRPRMDPAVGRRDQEPLAGLRRIGPP